MSKEIIELHEDVSQSPLYSEDLAPVPPSKRTWNTWSLAAIWVGMAVCIPTYLLAAGMITDGISWWGALLIIGLANLIITIPMVLNGHAGVKYGVPFPVIGRSSFGTKGIHIAAVVRAVVACGWFGIQTWIGGLAIYAIWNAVTGNPDPAGLNTGEFIGFGIFWLINVFFIWKGTETIKWLEIFSAPILILMGIVLIAWGANTAGGFGNVLENSSQMARPSATLQDGNIQLNPLKDKDGKTKATHFQVTYKDYNNETVEEGIVMPWTAVSGPTLPLPPPKRESLFIEYANMSRGEQTVSSIVPVSSGQTSGLNIWTYVLALTAMVGFWATMSLSIADITRYAPTQREQVAGQFIGLPGTMILYSFVGIFVTCAAALNFEDILIREDAPWDPVKLLSKFDNPMVVIISQIFMIIATLSTNIAANVIAPANAFANLWPQKISFRVGGVIAAVIGIVIMPWLLINEIIGILVFISGLLGPVLGIMLADYFVIRKKVLDLDDLFKVDGIYSYASGFNPAAMVALAAGVGTASIGFFVPALAFLYSLSWFTGFLVAFGIYIVLMKRKTIARSA